MLWLSETPLERALDSAANYATISDNDRHIILQAKQSLLFNKGNLWQKRNIDTLFDITMGSYERAETWELVGNYILSQLKEIPYIQQQRSSWSFKNEIPKSLGMETRY